MSNGGDRYRLRPGDTIELSFPFVSAFNQTVTVQPDGYIILRPIGDVSAKNQTIPELTAQVRTRYLTILREPVITIEVKDFIKDQFTVTGEVEHAGKYDLRGDVTVAQALAIAGGFKQGAKRSGAMLYRAGQNDGAPALRLTGEQLRGSLGRGALLVHPGDVIFVPKSHMPGLGALVSAGYLLTWLPK